MSFNRLTENGRADGFPVVVACYSWTWHDFHMTPHCHDQAEIMYLLHGECCVQIFDGGKQIDRRLGVGEFIFIDAGVMHALQVDESSYMVNVEFCMREHSALMSLAGLVQASPVLAKWLQKRMRYQWGKDNTGTFYAALEAVVDDYSNGDKVDDALKELRIGQMLILMASALMSAGANDSCLVHVRRCVHLLSEKLCEDVRIDALAAEVGISSAYLQRIFRQVQGETIIEYLNRMRIERAKLLLLNTDDPVIDIALAAGFNSRQHFTRVFTAAEGCSPHGYRSDAKKAESRQVFLHK